MTKDLDSEPKPRRTAYADGPRLCWPMISRILQLQLIDIMAVGMSLGAPEEGTSSDQARLLISHLDL
jgi:hypothetical protein